MLRAGSSWIGKRYVFGSVFYYLDVGDSVFDLFFSWNVLRFGFGLNLQTGGNVQT